MIKTIIFFIALLYVSPAEASEVPNDIQSQLKQPEKIGEVQVRFLGIRMYEAALFTKQGAPFKWSQPFALELTYLRRFSKQRLVKASISELERVEGQQSDHAGIASKLDRCFRTVGASDRFVAVPQGRNAVHFYFNGRLTCRLQHSGIRNRLLGIWLADNSRDRQLSRTLRGL